MKKKDTDKKFMLAVQSGDLKKVFELLVEGANINFIDSRGHSALMNAIYNEDIPMLRFLIQNRIDINLNKKGHGAIHVVCAIGNLKILEELIMNGIDLHLRDTNYGTYGIHWAVQESNYEIVAYLLKNNVDPNLKQFDGVSSLDIACSAGHYEIAKLLLDSGANVNSRRNNGETPLHLACAYGNYEIVELLLHYQANIGLREFEEGKLPISYAIENEHSEIVKLLSPGYLEND